MKKSRRTRLWLATALVAVVIALVLGELAIRIFSPTEYLSPRYQFSNEYGLLPFANVVMVHGVPGKYEYRYTVNSMRSRGEVVEPGASKLPTVVVLGDSYAFGMGVADGEEFPSVMRRSLAGKAVVANLGSPGWGLTQEIRRYFELGSRYQTPQIVVLQFCANDPDDNFSNPVTRIRDGNFVFVDSDNATNQIKKLMSRSPLQRTQLYNFFRARLSIIADRRIVGKKTEEAEKPRADAAASSAAPVAETIYAELLTLFAQMLSEKNRELWVISVDNQLGMFPHIESTVRELEASGDLRYLEVTDWLRDYPDHASPEGHMWGTTAHRVIGEELAAQVIAALPGSASAAQP